MAVTPDATSPSPATRPESIRRQQRRVDHSRSSSWTVRCAQGIDRLQAAVAAIEERNDRVVSGTARALDADSPTYLNAAIKALRHAGGLLADFRSKSLIPRLLSSSDTYVAVLADLQTATEQLIYVQDDEALLGMVPDLAGAVRNYLSTDDPRRETYLNYLTNLQAQISADLGPGSKISTSASASSEPLQVPEP
jgi:hypothetical protein